MVLVDEYMLYHALALYIFSKQYLTRNVLLYSVMGAGIKGILHIIDYNREPRQIACQVLSFPTDESILSSYIWYDLGSRSWAKMDRFEESISTWHNKACEQTMQPIVLLFRNYRLNVILYIVSSLLSLFYTSDFG